MPNDLSVPLQHTRLDADQLRIAQDAAYLAGKAVSQQVWADEDHAAIGAAVAEAVVAGWLLAVELLSAAAAPSNPGP